MYRQALLAVLTIGLPLTDRVFAADTKWGLDRMLPVGHEGRRSLAGAKPAPANRSLGRKQPERRRSPTIGPILERLPSGISCAG